MRRIAILIGTSESKHGDLDGVEPDLASYSEFLMSPCGGAWRSSEIIKLHNPSKLLVLATIAIYRNVDYSLITFSGHGGHDAENGTAVVVSDDFEPFVSALQTDAPRQLIIVDACRNVTELAEGPSLVEGIEKVASFTPGYTQSCRRLYESQISMADEGRSILYSCSINQSAGESSLGGYFSSALVQSAVRWARAASRREGARDVLDVPAAFSAAASVVRAKHFPQRPVMENGRRRLSFPLAVR